MAIYRDFRAGKNPCSAHSGQEKTISAISGQEKTIFSDFCSGQNNFNSGQGKTISVISGQEKTIFRDFRAGNDRKSLKMVFPARKSLKIVFSDRESLKIVFPCLEIAGNCHFGPEKIEKRECIKVLNTYYERDV